MKRADYLALHWVQNLGWQSEVLYDNIEKNVEGETTKSNYSIHKCTSYHTPTKEIIIALTGGPVGAGVGFPVGVLVGLDVKSLEETASMPSTLEKKSRPARSPLSRKVLTTFAP